MLAGGHKRWELDQRFPLPLFVEAGGELGLHVAEEHPQVFMIDSPPSHSIAAENPAALGTRCQGYLHGNRHILVRSTLNGLLRSPRLQHFECRTPCAARSPSLLSKRGGRKVADCISPRTALDIPILAGDSTVR